MPNQTKGRFFYESFIDLFSIPCEKLLIFMSGEIFKRLLENFHLFSTAIKWNKQNLHFP